MGYRFWIPLGGGSRVSPLKGFFLEKYIVKYCNFIVNIDCSLGHIYDGRSYVNLGFFSPGRNPSIIYERIILWLCIILREETMRE